MFDGARWRSLILILVLTAPFASASAPAPNLATAATLDGQVLSDVGMDPTGEFVAAVVKVDTSKLIPIPGQPTHHDIYPCDFGPVTSVRTGSCRAGGLDHSGTTDATATPSTNVQSVSYVSYPQNSGGIQPVFAVGGPAGSVSLWTGIGAQSLWETSTRQAASVVGNVSLAPDGSLVAAAILPTNTALAGSIEVYNASTGSSNQVPWWTWSWSDQRPTAMAYARTGGLLAVGTNAVTTASPGVYLFHPASGMPSSSPPALGTEASVQDLALSRDGSALAIATTAGIEFVPLFANGTAQSFPWSLNLPGGASRVALSLDGRHFAAASGSKVYFFQATSDMYVAQQVGDAYDTGSTVADLSYDATGSLLVAVAGNSAYGFAASSNAPIWSFDATSPAYGSVDGPLQRVLVSDGAERFVVGGQHTVMPYRSLVAATGHFTDQDGIRVTPTADQRPQTFAFTVQNSGSREDNYTFIARFPVGWNGNGPDSITLRPDESRTLNVSLTVPPGTAPGIYGVDVQVRSGILQASGASTAVVADPALNFTIPRNIVLNVTTDEDRIPSIHAGGSEPVAVTIRNLGNADGVVNLSASQALSRGAPWPITFDKPQVTVPATGSVVVNMIVTPGSGAASGDRNDITICAREGQPTTCQMDGSPNEATHLVTAYVDPKFSADLTSTNSSYQFGPGQIQTIYVKLTNTGNTDDTYNLTATITPVDVQNDWRAQLQYDHISVAHGSSRQIGVTLRPGVSEPRAGAVVIKAVSNGSGLSQASAITLELEYVPTTTTPTKALPAPGIELALLAVVAAAVAGRVLRRGGRN